MFGKQKICDVCKSNIATHFYKEIVNGHGIEICLCDDCAENTDLENHYNVFLSSLFGDMSEDFGAEYNEEYKKPQPKRVCKCGCTEEDILTTGRFGCSECYKTFSDLVGRYVDRLGGKTYSGNMPKSVIGEKVVPPSIEDQLAALRLKMKAAANNQDYAQAKEYKAQIEALQNKLK